VRCVREAVLHGLNVLDTDYEKLDVDVANSDSEDEVASATTTKTPVMFEQKVCLLTVMTYKMCNGDMFAESLVSDLQSRDRGFDFQLETGVQFLWAG